MLAWPVGSKEHGGLHRRSVSALNPHLPKRMISSNHLLDWLDEPDA
jgi:hypothetical protein